MTQIIETEKLKYEWEFDVPSDQLDIPLIADELSGLPAVVAYSYVGELKWRAPIAYQRLRTWAIENKRLTGIQW